MIIELTGVGTVVGGEKIGVEKCLNGPGNTQVVTAVTVAPFEFLLSLLVLRHQYSSFSSVKAWAVVNTTFSVTPRLSREASGLGATGEDILFVPSLVLLIVACVSFLRC